MSPGQTGQVEDDQVIYLGWSVDRVQFLITSQTGSQSTWFAAFKLKKC